VAAGVCLVASLGACSSQPSGSARERFVQRLQQPGPHRFDQMQVGEGTAPLDATQAACVADAFESNRWPLDAALENRVPTRVDIKEVSVEAEACLRDPGTTTIDPFG
jgi:hypothetical protein